MTPKNKRAWHLLLVAVVLIISCGMPNFSKPSIAPPQPGAVDTIVAQTAGAAATQTVRALPTSTNTPTATFTPRNTATVTPTATSTVIFRFKTSTLPGSSGSGGSGGSGSGGGGGSDTDKYSCKVVSISPGSGTQFSPRASFDAKVKVNNKGTKSWEVNSVDYAYKSGDKFHTVALYDLKGTIGSGSSTTIAIDMQAPKNSGVYSTVWGLKTGADNFFCTFTITIVVK